MSALTTNSPSTLARNEFRGSHVETDNNITNNESKLAGETICAVPSRNSDSATSSSAPTFMSSDGVKVAKHDVALSETLTDSFSSVNLNAETSASERSSKDSLSREQTQSRIITNENNQARVSSLAERDQMLGLNHSEDTQKEHADQVESFNNVDGFDMNVDFGDSSDEDDSGSVYDEIPLDEMEFEEAEGKYTYPCPCGDLFEIYLEDLQDGEDIAYCPSCSLKIKVLYNPEEV